MFTTLPLFYAILGPGTARLAAAAAAAAAAADAATAVSLAVPSTAPEKAYTVPPSFLGIGIETAFLPSFHNDFSANLMAVLAGRAPAEPPIVRVGGTSGDLVQFDASQDNATKCVGEGGGCPHNSESTFVLGPSYFDAFAAMPAARMTFQAPLGAGPGLNMSQTMAYVENARRALGDRVAGIALGNEPQFFEDTAAPYVDRALRVQENIVSEFGLEGNAARIFEMANTASGVIDRGMFAVPEIFDAGINKNGLAISAAEHYYQVHRRLDDYGGPVQQRLLMNHTALTARLDRYVPHIEYLAENYPEVPYILSESSTAIGGAPANFSASFGAGLSMIDFHFACLCRGVRRVVTSQRPVSRHSVWVPDNSAPANGGPGVRPLFAAAVYIADFVEGADGAKRGTGVGSKVAELPVGNAGGLSAYGMWGRDGGLAKVAVINMRRWDGRAGSPRAGVAFTLDVGDGVSAAAATVRRLHADAGARAMGFDIGGPEHNATWAGEQWTHKVDLGKGHFPLGGGETEGVEVVDGKAVIDVPNTEAVVIYFA